MFIFILTTEDSAIMQTNVNHCLLFQDFNHNSAVSFEKYKLNTIISDFYGA